VLTPFIHKTGEISTLHGVKSGYPRLLDSRRILIPDFSFDATAPSVNFIIGVHPTPEEFPNEFPGVTISNEQGSCAPLRIYNKKSIVLTLPEDLTFHSVDWIGLYCKDFNHVFGFIEIPKPLKGIPAAIPKASVSANFCRRCPTSFLARFLKGTGYYFPACKEII